MSTISAQELTAKINNNENIQLIDLREDYEYEELNLGGINIPMSDIFNSLDQIEKDKLIVFICKYGKKSGAIIHTLKRKLNMDNLFSLEGGIDTYYEII